MSMSTGALFGVMSRGRISLEQQLREACATSVRLPVCVAMCPR